MFEYASIRGNLAIKIKLDDKGGVKTYLTNDFDEPPAMTVELNNEKEEKVFLLFRYPDIESDFVKAEVRARINRGLKIENLIEKGIKIDDIEALGVGLREDYEFKQKYFGGANSLFDIRCSLRERYKERLFLEAKRILGVSEKPAEEPIKEVVVEVKPAYKSKTVVGNVLIAILIALASMLGIQLSPEEVATIFAVVNIILRFFTKQPIKI